VQRTPTPEPSINETLKDETAPQGEVDVSRSHGRLSAATERSAVMTDDAKVVGPVDANVEAEAFGEEVLQFRAFDQAQPSVHRFVAIWRRDGVFSSLRPALSCPAMEAVWERSSGKLAPGRVLTTDSARLGAPHGVVDLGKNDMALSDPYSGDPVPLERRLLRYYREMMEVHTDDPAIGTCLICKVRRCPDWRSARERLLCAGELTWPAISQDREA
jgi:hypothetical protein